MARAVPEPRHPRAVPERPRVGEGEAGAAQDLSGHGGVLGLLVRPDAGPGPARRPGERRRQEERRAPADVRRRKGCGSKMTDADEIDFQDGLTALAIVTGQAVTKPMRAAYWQFLRDLQIGDFKRAVVDAGRTLRFFPKPSEIRDLAGAGPKANALVAWDTVRAAMRRYGYTTGV